MSRLLIACFLCLAITTAVEAATINVEPDSNNIAPNNTFSAFISSLDIPETGGATLGLTFNANVIHVTGLSLAPSSPFDTISPSAIDNVNGQIEFISLLPPLYGALPSGNFDVFSIDFLAVAPGFSAISLIDDAADGRNPGDVKGWTGTDFLLIENIVYNQGEVTVVPLPAAAWLFLSAVGVLGYRGKRRKTEVI